MNLGGGRWHEAEVEGVPALVIDGTPVDAMEVALTHWGEGFDWIVSGINWGANVGPALISSGTFAAAFRGLGINIAKKAIAISWMVNHKYILYRHSDENTHLEEEFAVYPGKKAVDLVAMAVEAENWGVDLVNINLPENSTNSIAFTKPLDNLRKFYELVVLDEGQGQYMYPDDIVDAKLDPACDVAVLKSGEISIMPCVNSFGDLESMRKLREKR